MTDEGAKNDMTNESTNPLGNNSDKDTCTADDLIDLVRAVKFAHTEMSIRNVHQEISVTMANSDPSYKFLKDVKLNDVKKVWKKALKGSLEANSLKKELPPPQPEVANVNSLGSQPIVPADGIIKLYTVGDGSVKTLAENYAHHHAEAAVAASRREDSGSEREKGKYTHFFLDVPANMSGSRHQALINFQENQKTGRGGRKGKNCSRKSKLSERSSDDGRELFKIQLAAPGGMEDTPTPMLLYNPDRSARTFLHPPSSTEEEEDDGGYFEIRKMITESGMIGALGATGGQKAYFYGFVTKTKSGPNVVSIDIQSGPVPSQSW